MPYNKGSSGGFKMSVDEMMRHDDYEVFAKYLGLDYEDYVELIGDFELSEDEVEVEYALSVF